MSEWLNCASDRAVRKFDHRMDDALRMDNHFHPLHLDSEKPVRLDHLEAFVEERGRIDRDFRSHVPGRMLQRLFRRDRIEFVGWRFAKWSTRRGQDEAPNVSVKVQRSDLAFRGR